MIHINLTLGNPFNPITFNSILCIHQRLSTHKIFECELYWEPKIIFNLVHELTFGVGEYLNYLILINLFGLTLSISLKDRRRIWL